MELSKKVIKSYEKKVPPAPMFVYPAFRTKLKVEAAQKNMSIIDYTKHLSGIKSLEEEFNESSGGKKKREFSWRL